MATIRPTLRTYRYRNWAIKPSATRWAYLKSSDFGSPTDPNSLLTSFGNSGREMQFRGSLRVGAQPATAYETKVALKDPETGVAVDVTDGKYEAVQFWCVFGTNEPDAANECFWVGVTDPAGGGAYGSYRLTNGGNEMLGTGTRSSTQNAGADPWGADDVLSVMVGFAYKTNGTAASIDYVHVYQMDDTATPARILDKTAESAPTDMSATTPEIRIAFSGDIDVTVRYRLIKARGETL